MKQLKIIKSITNRDEKSTEKYLQEVNKLDMISPLEEVELAKMIRKGDQRALERLVNANLRFVVSVAKQYQHQGLTLNDLINEGNVGLVKAAQKFDETRGFKFISYAVWWIRQSIMAAVSENSRMIRVPLNKVGLIQKIKRATNILETELDREPDIEELALYLSESPETVKNALREIKGHHKSIHETINEDSELLDVLESDIDSPDIVEEINSQKKQISRYLEKLSPQEKRVVTYFFGIDQDYPMSLEDIGKTLGKTRERIRQIKDKAINRLRNFDKKSPGLKSSFI